VWLLVVSLLLGLLLLLCLPLLMGLLLLEDLLAELLVGVELLNELRLELVGELGRYGRGRPRLELVLGNRDLEPVLLHIAEDVALLLGREDTARLLLLVLLVMLVTYVPRQLLWERLVLKSKRKKIIITGGRINRIRSATLSSMSELTGNLCWYCCIEVQW
jgi:hypothetical protein